MASDRFGDALSLSTEVSQIKNQYVLLEEREVNEQVESKIIWVFEEYVGLLRLS